MLLIIKDMRKEEIFRILTSGIRKFLIYVQLSIILLFG